MLGTVGHFADQEWEHSQNDRPGAEDKYKAYDTIRMYIYHLIR